MNPKIAVSALLLIGSLFMQSCSQKDNGPKTKVEITFLEEVKDTKPMETWLRDFVKETTRKKGNVEIVSGGKALTIEIPLSALGEVRAALESWEGPKASGLGMHATKKGTQEEAKAIALGTATIADHTALPYRDRPGEYLVIKSASVIAPEEIKFAQASYGSNGWEIRVQFTPSGAKKMLAFTTANRNELVAIVLNEHVLSAPNINEPFSDGCIITGSFTEKEASTLSMGFNNPPPLKYKVSPKAKPAP
ncbi:MAG: SecDF P1 head subdomain-containing protein [Verrucomicrobiales bacterium]